MSLSAPEAQLTGVFLESLSYGVYLVVFMQCMQVLRRRQSRPSDYLVGTAVSLFVLVTGHVVVDIVRNMEAFTSNMGIPNYAVTYYNDFSAWKTILKSALYVAITIISDAFILYRSFIVWSRSYFVTVIPFMLFLADIVVGIFWVYTLSLVPTGDNIFTDQLALRLKLFYSITLSMNVMCTCLIALKIWKIQRVVAPFVVGNQSELSCLVAIIVESGFAYSTILVVLIATYASNSPVMYIFLNSLSPIIGIVFSSVIVRVGLGLSHGDAHSMRSRATGTQTQWASRASGRHATSEQPFAHSLGSFPDGGVQVALSQTVHTHIDRFPAGMAATDVGSADVKRGGFHVV